MIEKFYEIFLSFFFLKNFYKNQFGTLDLLLNMQSLNRLRRLLP